MFGDMIRGEMEHGCCSVEGANFSEKGKRERSTQGNTQGEYFPKVFFMENERE